MTSILKSDSTKNGIILKENTKKFEEATSTSGCDLEMSEITSSMPTSQSLNNVVNCLNMAANTQIIVPDDIHVSENVQFVKVNTETLSEIEDVIDGFSVFSFTTEDDLMKFSIKSEKIETLSESENIKCKKIAKCKKQNKLNKVTKELSGNEDSIDIYDFQGNSESSPSSKNSSINFKKSLSKKLSAKYIRKFKLENTLSPSEGNSSSASVTESHNTLLGIDGRNESPRPTSNDDNNVVSTTTPDNVNIELEKLDLANSIDKLQSSTLTGPLKTAALRLHKLEDDLTGVNRTVTAPIKIENTSEFDGSEQQISAFHSASDNVKVFNNQTQITFDDENFQPKLVPTKFSVDLLTKITDKKSLIDDSNRCLSNPTCNVDWGTKRKSPGLESTNNNNHSTLTSSSCNNKHIVFDSKSAVGDPYYHHSTHTKMTSSVIKPPMTTTSFNDDSIHSHGSYQDVRVVASNESQLSIDDDSNNNNNDNNNEKKYSKSSANSPMQSWLELHTKGLLHQQHNALSHSNGQTNSNTASVPPKAAGCSSFNPSQHSNKSHHDSNVIDWKSNYFDGAKLLANSIPKFNQNFSTLSHELANNIRYQQEHQDLMNALRLKHENSKIPKPLVHMGLDSLYKVDHSLYKNPESRFQTPNVHNYFMPNAQLPTEFNTANVFKTRSEPRCHQTSADNVTSKDSFSKLLPALSSSNFKTPETVKRRGQWCDMHVKIAYFISRSQRRISMLKSQEINSQLTQLMYSQNKIPSSGPVPTASPYPSGYLQHSSPYLDYRSAQIKPDAGCLNYQSKSSNAFLNNPIRPSINPYHSIIPHGIDVDLLTAANTYDDHHQSPEQKWLRLLSQYMSNHPLSSVERPNPDILNQLYMWYQQFAQNSSTTNTMPHFNTNTAPTVPLTPSNTDANSVYLRKYMEHLSSCLGTVKSGDSSSYMNNNLTERDMQMYLLKQQQYQKALMSKYQTAAINKPTTMNHINPHLLNSNHPFYSKKLHDMKSTNNESMLPQYSDCGPPLVNSKYRLTHDQIRQMKPDSLANHHSRNGFAKLPDFSNPKRRKLNSESLRTDIPPSNNISDKEETKSITDLTGDYVNIATVNINNNNNNNSTNNPEKVSLKSRENSNFHHQTVISPDSKE